MLEHRRQHYLSLLGIDNYVPTRVLAHAAPSILLPDELLIDPALLRHDVMPAQIVKITNDDSGVVPQVATNDIARIANGMTNESIDTGKDVAGPREAVAKDLQTEELKRSIDESVSGLLEKSNPIDRTEAIFSSEKNNGVLAPVKFVFSVWRVKDMLILDTRKVREALPTDHLLQNILRSVGYSTAQLPVSESLRWPLFANKKLLNKEGMNKVELDVQYKNDVSQARAMVQAYISAQHSKSPLRYLFLMGEDVTTFTLDDSINFVEANGSAIQTDYWDTIQCLIIPSLYSMLQDPSSKRIAWNALQLMNSN